MKGFRSPAARKKKAAEQEVLSNHSSLYPNALIFTSNHVHRLCPGCGCYLVCPIRLSDKLGTLPKAYILLFVISISAYPGLVQRLP